MSSPTPTERYLSRLARRSFLSMWSYPSLYRDQGVGARGEGAELCDLLVIFSNDVIIFSDKDCEFPSADNLDVAWGRWFRRAVWRSAVQIWGADRWLRQFPDRVFLDRACKLRFPISLPRSPEIRVHRIVVAHDTIGRRANLAGGSGTLLIDPTLHGLADHTRTRADGGPPFAVGRLDDRKGFVHVLDAAGESGGVVVLGELGREVDSFLMQATDSGFNGTVLAATDGRIVLHKGYGWAREDQSERVTTETPFWIASYGW